MDLAKFIDVANAMRAAGVAERLTVVRARRWKAQPGAAPEWFDRVVAEDADRKAARQVRRERREREEQQRSLERAEQVEQRLLRGAKRFRNPDDELIAVDLALRAMKELLRGGGDANVLDPLEVAALRWAGVDPAKHSTWFLHGGGCCDRAK